MATRASDIPVPSANSRRGWNSLWAVEDWWSIWIGLGLVATAILLYRGGGSLKWLAISPPAKWHDLALLASTLAAAWPQYVALFVLWAGAFGIATRALGASFLRFVRAFAALFALSVAIFSLGQWEQARQSIRQGLPLALGILDYNHIASDLGLTAIILAQQGQPFRAARLSGASQALWARQKRKPWEDSSLDTILPGWRERPDALAITEEFEAGLALSGDEAVAYVLSDEADGTAPPSD